MEGSELENVPEASLPTEEAHHPVSRQKEREGDTLNHIKPKAIPPSPKSEKRKRKLSSEDAMEEDAMYFSPWDSSSEVYFVGLFLIILVSLATRLHKIDEPPHVAWDETHFGKHASWYIQGRFFFDVHPPLGKLIIAVAGLVTGYNGSFEFKEPGQAYEDTPYVGMRVVCAILGLLVAPLAYLTVSELTRSNMAALLAGVMVVCDTGTLILSRYILLDPPLLFFIMAATFTTAKFLNCRHEPFDIEWWYWLLLSGIFLGCAFSVKWVGAFVVTLVGLTTIKDLWDLLGDLTLSMTVVVKHFMARALCLIVSPCLLYMIIFAFHFLVLSYSGNGDGFFSSEFQSTLEGNELYERAVPEYVANGSVITLKNRRGGGGLLHSHGHLYPEEEGQHQQQQVTAYTHKDDNNKWLVKLPARQNSSVGGSENPNSQSDQPEALSDAEDTPTLIRHGDLVVLEHIMTKRNLHSHPQKAPMTKTHYQVTCYGHDGKGDTNDYWRVELVDGSAGDPVRTVSSRLRLRHATLGCYLYSHSKQLPKWGWEQLEVTCNPRRRDKNSIWNVEGNMNAKLPNISTDFYKPSFLSKFLEAHAVMAESNNNLKPKEGEVTSQPWQWPLNYHGQIFSGGNHRVLLLGNPVVFWVSGFLLIVFLSIAFLKCLADQRGAVYESINDHINSFLSSGGWLLLGWSLHYLPFFLMGRVLYFHHYFPALQYAIMLAGVVVEFVCRVLTVLLPPQFKSTFYHSTLVLFIAVMVGSFIMFKPLAYGMSGPKADDPSGIMHGLKWLSTWDI